MEEVDQRPIGRWECVYEMWMSPSFPAEPSSSCQRHFMHAATIGKLQETAVELDGL